MTFFTIFLFWIEQYTWLLNWNECVSNREKSQEWKARVLSQSACIAYMFKYNVQTGANAQREKNPYEPNENKPKQ